MKSVKCTNLFFLQLLLISTRISNYFQHCSSRMNRLHENNSEILIPVLVRLTLKQSCAISGSLARAVSSDIKHRNTKY